MGWQVIGVAMGKSGRGFRNVNLECAFQPEDWLVHLKVVVVESERRSDLLASDLIYFPTTLSFSLSLTTLGCCVVLFRSDMPLV